MGIRLDLTEIDIILRENIWFNENWYDFTRKCIIFRENWNDITRKGMILREKVWFRKLIWFYEKQADLTKIDMI